MEATEQGKRCTGHARADGVARGDKKPNGDRADAEKRCIASFPLILFLCGTMASVFRIEKGAPRRPRDYSLT